MNAAVLVSGRLAQARLDVIPTLGLAAQYDFARVNLLYSSDDLSQVAWAKNANATVSGSPGNQTITCSVTNYASVFQDVKNMTAGQTVTFSWVATILSGNPGYRIYFPDAATDYAAAVTPWPAPDSNGVRSVTLTLPAGVTRAYFYPFSVSSPASATYSRFQLNTGLLAGYERTAEAQTLLDRSGNNLNGYLGTTPATDVTDPTVTSTGLLFDGTDDVVTLPTQPGGNLATGDSFTFVLTQPAPGAPVATIYAQGAQSASNGYFWMYRPGGTGALTAQYSRGDGFVAVTSANVWSTGDLVTVVYDYPNLQLRFYRNGVLVHTAIMFTPVAPASGTGYLGRYSSTTHYASGTQPFYQRHTRALTDREVMRMHRAIRKRLALRGVTLTF